MDLINYDGKYVCIKDIYGNTFSGRARYGKSIDEIDELIPLLTCSDLDKVKKEIKKRLG